MKKLHLVIALALPMLLAAQDKVKFGINAGATLSDIRGSQYADDLKYGFNYLIGVSAELPITDRLSFSANINYEKKSPTRMVTFLGAGPNVPDPGDPAFATGDARFTTTLHYISVPLNIKYYIGSKKKFYATGGLFAAFLIDSSLRADGNKVDDSGNLGFKTVDFGLNLGLGTKIKLTETQNLNIELRDNLGFANISNNNYASSDKIRTNSINLIANWQFDL
jgi:hypothetical protein